MTKDELIFKIANVGIKQVVRKYPYIISGEFVETFEVRHSYLPNPNDLPITGVRVIFWVDPEIFFSIYPKDSYLYGSITKNRFNSTMRYLSSVYKRGNESEQELEQVDNEISDIFYRTSSIMNATEKAGLLDFFIRYAFLGTNINDDFVGFTDFDTAYPPKTYY